jgi:uncharacterized membrane protein (DUF2068 family)
MEKRSKNFFVRHFGLRGLAIFEAGKGLLAVGFAVWILRVLHKDMNSVAEDMLKIMHRFLHINPDRHFYQWVLRGVGGLTPRTLWVIFSLAMIYVAIRFVEAAGLWLEKAWAEWFALISGSLYLPLEIASLIRRPAAFKWAILGINILIVVYLIWLLMDSFRRKREARAGDGK